ncbi:MAG: 3Fe-4S ferredoxin [Nocardia sp.]|nr:ferredoxin [Nocardia sp.]MCU1644923.1 3Fe-4S ferredoxin [Nocardia sp.]
MRIRIDRTKCEGIGICGFFAPTVFELDDRGTLALLAEDVPGGLISEIERAVEGCPTQAISIGYDER